MATASRVLDLADLRAEAALVLAPVDDSDPPVIGDVVDAIYPPVLLLLWGDPWVELGPGGPGSQVMGPCLYTARLQVLAIASRVEPGPGIETLEQLVGHVAGRFKADGRTWPPGTVSGPRQFPIGGTDYLGARITYDVPCTIGGT